MGEVARVEINQAKPTGPTAPEPAADPTSLTAPPATPAPEPKPAAETPKADESVKTPDPKPQPKPPVLTDEDVTKLGEEFAKDGKLSDESLKSLEEKGIPKALAVQFVAGQEAVRQMQTQAVFNEVGGQENFTKFAEWARQGNIPLEERQAFDATLKSGDITKIKTEVKGMYARYQGAVGSQPALLGGKAGPSGPAPFTGWDQVINAMKSPRYDTDSGYRAEVQARLAVSKF